MKDNETGNRIVPKLRFPEFRNKGEWNIESFKERYSFKVTNSFSRDNLNYDNGSVKNIHYGDIHTNFFNAKNRLDCAGETAVWKRMFLLMVKEKIEEEYARALTAHQKQL
jgi:type I restriction enzyme S subunit